MEDTERLLSKLIPWRLSFYSNVIGRL
ncbi:hypothetical protein LINPERPRIM_LOCUS28673 [Linum perenne]